MSSDPLTGTPQDAPAPRSRAPSTAPRLAVPKPRTEHSRKRGRSNTRGEDVTRFAFTGDSSVQELLAVIKQLTERIASLEAMMQKMERTENKVISKVANTEKAIKRFNEATKENLPPPKAAPTVKRADPKAASGSAEGGRPQSPPALSERMRRIVVVVEGAFSTTNYKVRDAINKALAS